jgi:hypothetical protein
MDSRYTYWISTGLVAFAAAVMGGMYFVAEGPAETFRRLGYPDYFRVLLGIAKLIGAAALVVPLNRSLKEWAYAGFTIDFGSAFISHVVVGDPVPMILMPAVAFAVLMVSYTAYHRYCLA